MEILTETNYNFDRQKDFYRGKVRDVYLLEDDTLIMVTTDRVSAFDVILPKGIPYKGQILSQIAVHTMKDTEHIVPNWMIDSPDPNVIIGRRCTPFKVEMVVRGYLAGHAARVYKSGKRTLCGVSLPEGLKENDKLHEPIITPTTKADIGGHDKDISKTQILANKIVSEEDYQQLENYTKALFYHGSRTAQKRGLLLVDTKYEFGKTPDGKIVLIDEIHTPDSSRYFLSDTYKNLQSQDKPQRQLSKEFVRQWLIKNGFRGKEGQQLPIMTDDYAKSVSDQYIELYEKLLGKPFQRPSEINIYDRIECNIKDYLSV